MCFYSPGCNCLPVHARVGASNVLVVCVLCFAGAVVLICFRGRCRRGLKRQPVGHIGDIQNLKIVKEHLPALNKFSVFSATGFPCDSRSQILLGEGGFMAGGAMNILRILDRGGGGISPVPNRDCKASMCLKREGSYPNTC